MFCEADGRNTVCWSDLKSLFHWTDKHVYFFFDFCEGKGLWNSSHNFELIDEKMQDMQQTFTKLPAKDTLVSF